MQEEDKKKEDKDINRNCPRCKAGFHCDEQEGCWCEKLTLDQATLKFLRMNYIDCLCENCLKTFDLGKN